MAPSRNSSSQASSSSNRMASSGGKKTEFCLKCKKSVDDQDKGLSCQKCFNWYHSHCLNMTAGEYKVLTKYENLMWFCNQCKHEVDDMISKVSVRLDKTDKSLEDLSGKMDKILDKLDEKCSKSAVKEIVDEAVESKIEKKIQEFMSEKEEREKRKSNLMLFNVPESEDENVEQRIDFDRDQTELVLQKLSNRRELVENPKRMGKKGENPRPLRVTLESPDLVTKFVKKGKDLKEFNDEEYTPETLFMKKVFLSPDLTARQRTERKTLVDELKVRRANGETNLRIFQGKVVSKPPGGPAPGRGGRD